MNVLLLHSIITFSYYVLYYYILLFDVIFERILTFTVLFSLPLVPDWSFLCELWQFFYNRILTKNQQMDQTLYWAVVDLFGAGSARLI